MSEIVEIDKLQYKWPGQKLDLLQIENLSVKEGERLFLMGASGSGKSTLLSLLGGIMLPQQGSIKILDQPLSALKPSLLDEFRADHIGYIFQQFNLVPYLSVIDNVTLPCQFSNKRMKAVKNVSTPHQEALRLLSHLGIKEKELLEKPVTELSVGQQQRVAAARALIGSPELLIADEPTSALDADAQEAFIQLLFQECKAQNTTLIFVSHDVRFSKLFDRTIKLKALANEFTQELTEGGLL